MPGNFTVNKQTTTSLDFISGWPVCARLRAQAPSPRQTRVFPGLAIMNRSKSETSDLDRGEGWGQGDRLFDRYVEIVTPSSGSLREPSSPHRGEVEQASRSVVPTSLGPKFRLNKP